MRAEARTPIGAPLEEAVFVGPAERPVFVWHHAPPPERKRRAGIVLCPPLGYEYMSSYRTYRILARRLSALGFDVIRVDYDGTGNSSGHAEDAGRMAAWLLSLRHAMTEARRCAGSETVFLVGLRGGSILALQAAVEDGHVAGLVLWHPYSSGRAYVRELKAMARLTAQNESEGSQEEAGIRVDGYVFTRDAVETMSLWTLDEVVRECPAPEVLLIGRNDRTADAATEAHLKALGTSVTRVPEEGMADMLLPPHLSNVPAAMVDAIEAWFGAHQNAPRDLPRTRAHMRTTRFCQAVMHGAAEHPVRFGPDNRLFGMLARPQNGRPNGAAVILFNTGAGHHVGPHRLYVPLARDWASHGHVVLRFDLGGIGDSVPPPGNERAYNETEHMVQDAREAIDFIRREAPGRNVIAVGLCSGGWLAFQSARRGLPLDAFVSINAPLYLRESDKQWLKDGRTLGQYQQSLRDPAKWIKALRGRASYSTFTRVVARALARRVAVRVSVAMPETMPDSLANDLAIIARRGIAGLFVFSRGDNGLAYFEQHVPAALLNGDLAGLVQHVVVDEAGHAFRPRGAQDHLIRLATDFVNAHTGSAPVPIEEPPRVARQAR